MPQSTAVRILRRVRLGALAAALLGGVGAPARAEPIDDLRILVESSRADAAYTTFCAATDPATRPREFDLWCGIAAVDLGRAAEGVLALERYVLHFPDDLRGRLELARAYFYAGDSVRAREEFEAVAKENPPPAVQSGIERYLAALQAREGRYQTRSLVWVEAGAGYDSNANAGVAQAQIGLPALGPVTVEDVGVRKASPFGWLAAGGRVGHPVSPGWSVNAGAYANGTFYTDASEFNLAGFGASFGGSYQVRGNLYSLSYTHGEIALDGSRYRWTDGVGFEWRRQISERTSIALSPQYARLAYSGENAARNADLVALAASYRQIWLANWQPVLNASLFYGDEHNREGHDDLGRSGAQGWLGYNPRRDRPRKDAPMLEAQDLAARRGDAQLFSGVSLALGPGMALFVRGPNGSGKTTLLRILAGTTEAAQGRVLWRGERVGPFHPALRACALFIGHAPALKDELTAEENLASLTTLQGAPAERAAMLEALNAWSLSRQRALPARVLSQGQRRRISLARLRLLSRPLWLLDEPATALDDAGRVTLRDTLAAHLAAGGIAVIATHQDLLVTSGTHQSLSLA